ncbi:MAG TPA: PPOX class F420-dependent oxidoreductase [Thermomicrobiales bacterium]|jgi:pyridoxamine 5'-phosphate oxidase family protein|nr:PPOX class F420-dependent oxidoreductase [Thermomicrobiales bacterium]
MFDDLERAYLAGQRLARLATVSPAGQPDADAVGFEFDGERFFIGGRRLTASRKYKNIAAGRRLVSLIVDDYASIDPWRPRGVKVHGTAEIVQRDGRFGPGDYIAIAPDVSWSWGLDADVYADGRLTWKPRKQVWAKREA